MDFILIHPLVAVVILLVWDATDVDPAVVVRVKELLDGRLPSQGVWLINSGLEFHVGPKGETELGLLF